MLLEWKVLNEASSLKANVFICTAFVNVLNEALLNMCSVYRQRSTQVCGQSEGISEEFRLLKTNK